MEVDKGMKNKCWTQESIATDFKMPISFNEEKIRLEEHIIVDLELSGPDSVYESILTSKTRAGKTIQRNWASYYTKDKQFLKDTQKIYTNIEYKPEENTDEIMQLFEDLQGDCNFLDRYSYIDWNHLDFLNKSSYFLGFMGLYNIFSPLLALCLPIFLMILPFFILKLQGVKLTWALYTQTLMFLFRNNVVGQLLLNFKEVSWEKRVYLIISCCMYLFQIYSNIISCIRYHNNMKHVHHIFKSLKSYINSTSREIEKFITITNNLETYKPFISVLNDKLETLKHFQTKILFIEAYSWNVKEALNIGVVMKEFHQLYSNPEIKDALSFSFGFHGYLENINMIATSIRTGTMNITKFNTKGKTKFTKAYYPSIPGAKAVTNDYDIDKNMIVTGPNASGKTTLLKTTMINIILSQQIGCGFFKKATLDTYDRIHCYLNIPDTSGRDSLFQAEARRCKDILESIERDPLKRHFCVFDELYSGTNPYEAVATGVSYIEHLSKLRNVDIMITTHFIDLCKHLDKNKRISNCKMRIDIKDNRDFHYSYKLEKGISSIKGGVKVLKDLCYPETIIHRSENILGIS